MAWLVPGNRQRHGAALGGALALALALVLSQTWGLLHGVVHGGFKGQGSQAQWLAASEHSALHERGHGDFLMAAFGHSDSPTECCLYDQISHADALPAVVAELLPLVLQSCVLSVLWGLAVARWHAQFLARGPPTVP